ncbi:MAG: alpha/beta hydrolase [Kiritimatiellales bacterium]
MAVLKSFAAFSDTVEDTSSFQTKIDVWQADRLERLTINIRSYPRSAPVYRNVLYKQTNDWFGLIGIYMPNENAQKPVPVIVWFHGGGWQLGAKEDIDTLVLEEMTGRGFAVVSVGYRLCNFDPDNVLIHDCVTNCKDSIRFLVKNAEKYSFDSERIAVWGGSAGGHLAQMTALSPPESFPGDPSLLPHSVQPAAGISWFGPSDFVHYQLFDLASDAAYHHRWRNRIFIAGTSPEEVIRIKQEISPVLYMKKDSPPMMFALGDTDRTISYRQMELMQSRAEEVTASFRFLTVANAGHGWKKDAEYNPVPVKPEIVKQCADFIAEQLNR